MSAILLEGKIVHYEVLGRGRPIIFLHGWAGSWRYWMPCMQSAAASFRTYALDLWGFGDSAKDPSHYTLEQQTKLLDLFLQEMGIGKVAIIGHGLGALASLLLASTYPAVVDRIMLVNMPIESKNLSERVKNATSSLELTEWLMGRTHFDETSRQEASRTDIKAITTPIKDLETLSLLSLLDSFFVPCLFVHGQNDPAVQILDFDRIKSMPETVHQVILENCGHFPMLDATLDFNNLMTDFLSLDSGDSPRQLQLKAKWKRRVR